MLLLAGCLVGREKPDAALDIPGAYRTPVRNPDTALPTPDWWRGFRSRQLTGLVEEALTSNLDIAAAVARIVQADAQARIAGAALLPAVQLDADYSRSRSSRTTSPSSGTSSGGSTRTLYSTSLSASYEIDFWGKNRAALLAAENAAVASRFDREVVALTTVVSVATAYFQVAAAQERLRVARDNLAAAERVLGVIRDRFSVGTASALDVAQQESLVAAQRAAIPPLVQTLQQNIAVLALLIGRPPARVTITGSNLWQLAIPAVTPGLPSDLLTRRPDVREAEAQLAAANANVEAARAAFFPSIQLTGQGGYQSALLRTLVRPESTFFSLAAGLTQPIFDGALLQGQFDLQHGRQDELLQNYRRAVINAFTDVERALVAVQQTAEQERLQRDVVSSSRRAFEIAEQRLREGTVDLVTVLQTQQALFQGLDNLAQVRLARLLAVLSLFQALGGGWSPPGVETPDHR
ncbi:MAG TPA: efflux transporter outer membrane subunit [Xanthobacteraceae bacterium]|nr:efflux transporter outer membrane subunit [Xanthobacteraceae bacterium]